MPGQPAYGRWSVTNKRGKVVFPLRVLRRIDQNLESLKISVTTMAIHHQRTGTARDAQRTHTGQRKGAAGRNILGTKAAKWKIRKQRTKTGLLLNFFTIKINAKVRAPWQGVCR